MSTLEKYLNPAQLSAHRDLEAFREEQAEKLADVMSESERLIRIEGEINAEMASLVCHAVEKLGPGQITVTINSPGGCATSGLEIHEALCDHGEVVTHIIGEACSAGALIALGGEYRTAQPTSRIMIHGVQTNREPAKGSNIVDCFDAIQAQILTDRAGIEPAKAESMTSVETWLTAQEAKSLGVIDEITRDYPVAELAGAGNVDLADSGSPENSNLLEKSTIVDKPTRSGFATAIMEARRDNEVELLAQYQDSAFKAEYGGRGLPAAELKRCALSAAANARVEREGSYIEHMVGSLYGGKMGGICAEATRRGWDPDVEATAEKVQSAKVNAERRAELEEIAEIEKLEKFHRKLNIEVKTQLNLSRRASQRLLALSEIADHIDTVRSHNPEAGDMMATPEYLERVVDRMGDNMRPISRVAMVDIAIQMTNEGN